MDPLTFAAVIFAISVFGGALGSLLGLGGGIIVVPVLTLAGVNIRYAIGASIISVIATSSGAAATYVKDRITNLRLGMFLEMATTTGAVVGALLAALVPLQALSIAFGLVLAYAAVSSYRARGEEIPQGVVGSPLAMRLRLGGSYPDAALGRRVDYEVTRVPQGLGMMWVAGAISGFLGIGAGAFKVIAMDILMRAPLKVSTTTSNFMIGVTAAASAGIYFFRGDINPFIAAPVALGVLLGTAFGTRLLVRLRGTVIRKIFLVVLAVLAVQMIWHGIAGLVR